jgi:hypothetical protein
MIVKENNTTFLFIDLLAKIKLNIIKIAKYSGILKSYVIDEI